MELWEPEDGHHGVADELLDHAAVPLQLGPHRVEVARHHLPERLRVERLAEGRRALQVGEHDRHDLAVLLRRAGVCERGATGEAELRNRRVLDAAGSARLHDPSLRGAAARTAATMASWRPISSRTHASSSDATRPSPASSRPWWRSPTPSRRCASGSASCRRPGRRSPGSASGSSRSAVTPRRSSHARRPSSRRPRRASRSSSPRAGGARTTSSAPRRRPRRPATRSRTPERMSTASPSRWRSSRHPSGTSSARRPSSRGAPRRSPPRSGRSVASPRAPPGHPGAGLDALAEWASHARSSLFVARGVLEQERDRIVTEANALGSAVLGEQLGGSSAALVRERLEARLS